MRIVYIDPSAFSLPYDQKLCESVANLGHEVFFFSRELRQGECLIPRARFQYEPFFYVVSEKVQRIVGKRKSSLLLKGVEHAVDMGRLLKRIYSLKPDVIHFQWSPLPSLDRWFFKALAQIAPVFLTVHDVHSFHGSPSSRLQNLGWKQIWSECKSLIVLTENAKEELLALGVPADHITVIPHGLLPLTNKENQQDPFSGRKTLLFFGQLKPYKGVDDLLRAWAALSEEQKSGWQIYVAGEGSPSYIQKLKHLSRELGIQNEVIWENRYIPETDASRLMEFAKVLVFPYREIYASGAFKAALPFHKPTIASDIGVFSETMTSEENGLLYPGGDVDALSSCLERLMPNEALQKKLSRGVKKLLEQIKDWPEIAEMTVDLYQENPSQPESSV